MYIRGGRSLNVIEVMVAINERSKRRKIECENEDHLRLAAIEIVNLNDALLSGKRSAFAVCEKEPRGNLDSGGHHYSIYYIQDSEPKRFWTCELMKLWGCKCNKINRSIPYWTFFSSAIGMSRLLGATDGLFSFICDLGGCYCQIELL